MTGYLVAWADISKGVRCSPHVFYSEQLAKAFANEKRKQFNIVSVCPIEIKGDNENE